MRAGPRAAPALKIAPFPIRAVADSLAEELLEVEAAAAVPWSVGPSVRLRAPALKDDPRASLVFSVAPVIQQCHLRCRDLGAHVMCAPRTGPLDHAVTVGDGR